MSEKSLFFEEPDNRERHIGGELSVLRMPYNYQKTTVKGVLDGFLLASRRPYIVTGYTSLKKLVQFLSRITDQAKVQLLLGNEPSPSSPHAYKVRKQSFPHEVEEYWLEQGFSLRQSLELVTALERFENEQIEAQYLDIPGRMLHAKIYIAEDNAMIGSSNFSANGLEKNLEGNVCFKRTENEEEAKRYDEIKFFADWLWEHDEAQDYTDELSQLLGKLLRTVTWKESLARACAEILEGRWADEYLESTLPIGNTKIWPSQRKGVAQALCILDQLGSVLLADATGSGKTRLGSLLLRAMHDRVWQKGRARTSSFTTLVCPPGVKDNWELETARQGLQITPFSQGVLSNPKSGNKSEILENNLKLAQILCVDEAHNFLNEKSNRTKFLLRNMADHVILQTATPINKGASDLLSLINILGADNFDSGSIKGFNRYLSRKNKDPVLRDEHLKKLRKEIGRFSIRRTKADFNEMILKQPELYCDEHNRACHYPTHNALSYETGESESAIHIAREIRALAAKLQGVAYINKQISPNKELLENYSASELVKWRISMARAASAYHVMSHLRSSKAAVLKHLEGSEGKGNQSKGIIHKLQELAGQAPKCSFDDIDEIPDWIMSDEAHLLASKTDLDIYKEIVHLVGMMDSSREETKAQKLVDLIHKDGHQIVLAFDRHPATLFDLAERIEAIDQSIEVLIGTGSTDNKRLLEERLKPTPHSDNQKLVVLCSDAMSEGLNFQQSSTVVNLDMPSVVRLLEQRVGRIDRMDSIHDEIDVYWPSDSAEFSLRSDDKLIERHGTVDALLGSNVPLPEAFSGKDASVVDYKGIISEHEERADTWDGLEDAFMPIKRLIGKQGLVNQDQYDQIALHTQDIKVRLTVLDGFQSWAFFCIKGGKYSAPKWVFIEEGQTSIETDFEVISAKLFERLQDVPEKQSARIDQRTQEQLDRYLDQVASLERLLLPRRKQVALEQMHTVLGAYQRLLEFKSTESEFICDWLKILEGDSNRMQSVDWNSIAEQWLELIRPYWYEELSRNKTKRAVRLKDIEKTLIASPIPIESIRLKFSELLSAPSIEDRVVACIISHVSV
ncbi:SNF2-related protein [Neptuniibacter sp. QD57_21]|uniref:SNF2-related protein n=1 Tax=Neptuniibacter sp. QD57_21 TaxID=3398213 RepID=UPI0039F6398B